MSTKAVILTTNGAAKWHYMNVIILSVVSSLLGTAIFFITYEINFLDGRRQRRAATAR
jgi:hypothetical protein